MNFLGANSADICAVRYLAPVAAQSLLLPCHIRKDIRRIRTDGDFQFHKQRI